MLPKTSNVFGLALALAVTMVSFGVLGESCDLPTSACTNEYRDVQ